MTSSNSRAYSTAREQLSNYSRIFQNILEYSRIFSNIFEYFWLFLIYTLKYFVTFWNILEYSKIKWNNNYLEYSIISWSILEYSKIFQNIPIGKLFSSGTVGQRLWRTGFQGIFKIMYVPNTFCNLWLFILSYSFIGDVASLYRSFYANFVTKRGKFFKSKLGFQIFF